MTWKEIREISYIVTLATLTLGLAVYLGFFLPDTDYQRLNRLEARVSALEATTQ